VLGERQVIEPAVDIETYGGAIMRAGTRYAVESAIQRALRIGRGLDLPVGPVRSFDQRLGDAGVTKMAAPCGTLTPVVARHRVQGAGCPVGRVRRRLNPPVRPSVACKRGPFSRRPRSWPMYECLRCEPLITEPSASRRRLTHISSVMLACVRSSAPRVICPLLNVRPVGLGCKWPT
jgi:hypothetical protein